MKLKLQYKIIGLAIISALLPVGVLCLLLSMQDDEVASRVTQKIDQIITNYLTQVAKGTYGLCRSTNDLIQQKVDYDLNVARRLIKDAGGVRLGPDKTEWVATNQFTKVQEKIVLPKFYVGGQWLGQNPSMQTPMKIVDDQQALCGGTCTIFQRINEEGDMLRVGTNVATTSGTRALGTYIPAKMPDGSPNRVVATVLSGDTFHGSAYVVNAWYITAYEPLRDAGGRVIGMLYVGIKEESLGTLRRSIMDMEAGENGEISVMFGNDVGAGQSKAGDMVIPPSGYKIGDNRWDEQDADGRYFIREICEKAVQLKGGETEKIRYLSVDPETREAHARIAYYTYFEPWHWVICAEGEENDFYAARNETFDALHGLLFQTFVLGLLAAALACLVAVYLGYRTAQPIVRLTEVSRLVAGGDLDRAAQLMGFSIGEVNAKLTRSRLATQDETDKLNEMIRQMIEQLSGLISQMRNASYKLVSTATQISNASKQQESSVMTFGSSSSEVAAAVKQISATAQELVKTMQGVREVAGDTATLADSGRTGLAGMESTMRQLEKATASISSKLSVMSEKAGNINSVVTTISKVAEQTNLLSLNAAIEAEKAGEYGLGFGVVAREIRRLADQTAAATLDIDQTVREMQSAVSAGVMEMDKFSEEVRRGVEDTGSISNQLEQIIEQVQALTPRFESVGEGMESQSKGAEQISNAIQQLSQVAQQTNSSLSDLNRASAQLQEAVNVLKEEISKFNLGT